MDQLLDIDELIGENKRQEGNRISVFEGILSQCIKLIKKKNRERVREMYYSIPAFVFGKPKYNIDTLRNYLVYNLRDNGLRVDILDPFSLYVSWKETDIDLERYIKRKTQMETQHSDIYMLDRGPNHGTIKRDNQDRYRMMKFRQNRQLELQQQRQERFNLQRDRLSFSFKH